MEAKDAQIEIYKENNHNLEKILLNFSQNQTNIVVKLDLDSEKKTGEQPKEDLSYNYFQGANISGDVVMNNRDVVMSNYASEKKQNLAQAAAEIQELLEQLDKNDSQDRTSQAMTDFEKMTIASKAIQVIESNLTLKERVINALKAAGPDAFKEALNHPIANILLAAFEGWVEP
ncbi:MAG: hypothetical protein F6K39_19030 [Okeania sp. SIO3B3]|nr:hypothetical protein [Okeania sp. SIO3B3]